MTTSELPLPIVAAEWLRDHLEDVLVFDVRAGAQGREAYARSHVCGALFADLDRDLAKVGDPAEGGRHPLPPIDELCARLGSWGVGPDTAVVAYDDQGGANAAARLWWMLRAVGHRAVTVLDGGSQAAESVGVPFDSLSVSPRPRGAYPAGAYAASTVDAAQVDALRTDREARVIDVRAAFRYRGESEPIDPVAGHIPGAVNVPFAENLGLDGKLKSPAELARRYAEIFDGSAPEKRVVHCGSGVTACHTLLALELARLPMPALYVGSWGEWCRQPRPRLP